MCARLITFLLLGIMLMPISLAQDPGDDAATSLDLSASPYFPLVRSQGSQASCAAWAVAYYAQGYQEAEDRGWDDAYLGNPEHLLSPAWVYNMAQNGADYGAGIETSMKIMLDWGVPVMELMMYDPADPIAWGNESAYRDAPDHRIQSYTVRSWGISIEETKGLLESHIPVVTVINADVFGGAFSDGNYIVSSQEMEPYINHAITIVGYDDSIEDDGEIGAFKVVNSWGAGWADGGFFYLTYAAYLVIDYMAYAIDDHDHDAEELLTWRFIDPPSRDCEILVNGHKMPFVTSLYSMPHFMCIAIESDEISIEISAPTDPGTIGYMTVERPGGTLWASGDSVDLPCELVVMFHISAELIMSTEVA